MIASIARPSTIFVDQSSFGGDGASWATAFAGLQDALDVAVAGDVICVAQGEYRPAGPGGDRAATFVIVSGVTLAGGFSGLTEDDPNARDISLYPTILSGDLNGDDGPGLISMGDNSYHVLTATNVDDTTWVEGFTIASGNANGASVPHRVGAGIDVSNSSLTFRLCRFRNNRALFFGAAMHISDSSPTIEACTFTDNRIDANLFAGGAVASFGPTSHPRIRNSRFHGNVATLGGAIEMAGGNMDIASSVFSGNTASSGGAINVSLAGALSLLNCTFANNVASVLGGGVHVVSTNPDYFAVAFSNEHQLFRRWHRQPRAVGEAPFVTLMSCILWDNMDGSGLPLSGQYADQNGEFDPFQTVFSCVRGVDESNGNLNLNPAFLDMDGDDDVAGTLDDDLRLSGDSPCIDSGDPDLAVEDISNDLTGHARVLCGRVDMGAYEFGIADADCDRDVDLVDFGGLQRCFSGGGPQKIAGCEAFDFDGDAHIDLTDWEGFQNVFTGTLSPDVTARR